jgi:hypothetical protein
MRRVHSCWGLCVRDRDRDRVRVRVRLRLRVRVREGMPLKFPFASIQTGINQNDFSTILTQAKLC